MSLVVAEGDCVSIGPVICLMREGNDAEATGIDYECGSARRGDINLWLGRGCRAEGRVLGWCRGQEGPTGDLKRLVIGERAEKYCVARSISNRANGEDNKLIGGTEGSGDGRYVDHRNLRVGELTLNFFL